MNEICDKSAEPAVTEKKSDKGETLPPPKINLSAQSELSDDLKEFERNLISESDSEERRNDSAGTIYVQETTSGKGYILQPRKSSLNRQYKNTNIYP